MNWFERSFASLRSKIRLIFSIALLLLTALFVASIKFETDRNQELNAIRERAVAHYLYTYYLKTGKIDEAYLESQNFSLIKDKAKIVQIERYFKEHGKYKKYAVDTYRLQRVILINNDRFKLFIENKNKPKYPVKQTVIFSIVFLLIVMLYLWVIRSLRPLTELKDQIKKFSEGDLDIHCASDRRDEIAEVANEFDHAVRMIRELLQSRQLFLRAIMHELKTPIAKGRLISEMLPDEKNKARLHGIFERLNLLIDEFAKVEKITSGNYELDRKPYKMSDLLEGGIDLLLIDNPERFIVKAIKNDYVVTVDFELFTLVLKNMLDNAIKYAIDKKVRVVIDNGRITVANKGAPLPHPIDEYFKPFHASKSGLGLGLYIVKSIVDMHGMHIDYRYDEARQEVVFMID